MSTRSSNVRVGMVVRDRDGHELGHVVAVDTDAFHIEKGLFFPRDYRCRFEDVAELRGDEVLLTRGRDALVREDLTAAPARGADLTGAGPVDDVADEPRALDATVPVAASVAAARGGSSEQRVPLAREALEVHTREREAGQVRVHKDVVEEERALDVPVRRDTVHVERRPVQPERPTTSPPAFREEEVVVPLAAEQVEVSKRPVVDEEVVVRREPEEETRRVRETLRREEPEVRRESEVRYAAEDDDKGPARPF